MPNCSPKRAKRIMCMRACYLVVEWACLSCAIDTVGGQRRRRPEPAVPYACYAATLRGSPVAAGLLFLLFGMPQQPQANNEDGDKDQERLRLRNKFPPKLDQIDRPINEADRQIIVQSKPGILRRLLQHLTKHDANRR